jgi:hypothetical protein
MSVRECLRVFHPVDVKKYLTVLKTEFGAQDNPDAPEALVIGDPPQPFYKPKLAESTTEGESGGPLYLFILGFNYIPLHPDLVVALINHPELAPPAAEFLWTIEQDVVAKGTLDSLKQE